LRRAEKHVKCQTDSENSILLLYYGQEKVLVFK